MTTKIIRATKEDETLIRKYFSNVHRREFQGRGEGLEVKASVVSLVFFPPGTAHDLFWSYWHCEDGNASLTRTPPKFRGCGASLDHCIQIVLCHIEDIVALSKCLKKN